MPVYDEKYIKAKVWEFNGVIKTNFLGDEIRKGSMHYTCTACITIDSVMKMEKKYYPKVYLEERKYKMKKIKMSARIRIRIRVRWHEIIVRFRIKTWFWIIVTFLLTVILF